TYIPASDWGQGGCLVTYTLNGTQVNSFSNGPVSGNDPSGDPWLSPPRQALGWPFQLLPFVEQGAATQARAGVIRNLGQPAFVCPSRRGMIVLRGDATNNVNPNGGRPQDYAAAYFGPSSRATGDIQNDPNSFLGIIVPSEPTDALNRSDGTVGRDTPV